MNAVLTSAAQDNIAEYGDGAKLKYTSFKDVKASSLRSLNYLIPARSASGEYRSELAEGKMGSSRFYWPLRCLVVACPDQRLRGYSKSGVQTLHHRHRQRAPARQHLSDLLSIADKGDEIQRIQAVLFHVILDGADGIRKIERIVLGLKGLDQSHQDIEPIALRRVPFRAHQALDFLEGASIIALGFDRSDVHVNEAGAEGLLKSSIA